MKINRREFVASSSATLMGARSAYSSQSRRVSPGERLVGGFVGLGGMGRANLRDFLQMEDVVVAAVCDVWDHNRDRAAAMTAHQASGPARPYADFREVLDRDDLDFVVVATPDHWHALPTILACEAGKDVYVEKPLSHNISEGRRMVDAARRNSRIVQMGTQQRSGAHYQEAVRLIGEGVLGKVTRVSAWNYENESPHGIGNPPDTEPPEGLDWDFWLGPAPKVAFNPNRFIGSFRWFWDYSGGKLTDWGTHHIDIVHWAMDVQAPLSVSTFGGKYCLEDNRETPDTLEAVFEYPGFILNFSNRVGNSREPLGRGYGIEFYGTDGTLFLDRGGFEIWPETRGQGEEPVPSYLRQLQESAEREERPRERSRRLREGRTVYAVGEGSEQHMSHVRNFLDCVKSRRQPISDVETGHRSTTAPHLANISLHVGRRIYWDAEKEQIVNDAEAGKLLRREYRPPWDL